MRQLLESDLELVIDSGFIYVPLLFDPAIERETHTPWKTDTLARVEGRHFIKTLSLCSLVENYAKIHPDSYERLRGACLRKFLPTPGVDGVPIDEKLRTILFHVMPYFVRGNKGLARRRLGEQEILDLIGEKVNIPARFYEDANQLLDVGSIRDLLSALEGQETTIEPPKDGRISAHELRDWVYKALEVKIVAAEKNRLKQMLREREQLTETRKRHVAVLLYIANRGSLEIDGFGFFRIGLTDDYVVYKHTGEYALKDYYGRLYLFPDCKVAVSTTPPLRPFVIDTYKHPFLEGYGPGQQICLRDSSPSRTFNAANVIRALEEGISALLYGYSSRRRNGYHSLDRVTRRRWTADLDDHVSPPRSDELMTLAAYVRTVRFDDYRISKEHPKIASGDVQVTNEYTS